MKFLFSLTLMFISTQLFAANVEMGKYTAVPKDYPTAIAIIEIKADGTAGVNIDADGIIINCAGTYNVEENTLNSHVNCDHPQVPEVNVSIDFTNVTPENLRSEEGVIVLATFDLLGEDPVEFILKKAD